MHFRDCIKSDSEWNSYNKVLCQLSGFLDESVQYLIRGYRIADEVGSRDQKPHHITVTLLTRHVCEFVDGISVLAGKGSAEPCKPLLRSEFEAFLYVFHVLRADTERRAIAYQVAHAHKKIAFYEKMMPEGHAGHEFRKVLQSDVVGSHFRPPAFDHQKAIEKLSRLFLRPEFADVEQAWQDAKRKSRRGAPPWFSLFGGPPNIAKLAAGEGFGGCYEILYRYWSDAVHAGGVLENVKRDDDGHLSSDHSAIQMGSRWQSVWPNRCAPG